MVDLHAGSNLLENEASPVVYLGLNLNYENILTISQLSAIDEIETNFVGIYCIGVISWVLVDANFPSMANRADE